MGNRGLGTSHLTSATLAAQLAHGFDQRKNAVHTRVHARQAATVGVHRQTPTRGDRAIAHKSPRLAFLQKPRSSKNNKVLMVNAS